MCLLHCKRYTLKALLNLFLCAECFFFFNSILCFCMILQYISCSVPSSRLPPRSVCGWFCGVKVMLWSWMLRREETEVLGKSSALQAMRPTSGAATQLRTDSCRHPVWVNSWPGCLGEKKGVRERERNTNIYVEIGREKDRWT